MKTQTLIRGISKVHATKVVRCNVGITKLFYGVAAFSLISLTLFSLIQNTPSHEHEIPNYKTYFLKSHLKASLVDSTLDDVKKDEEPRLTTTETQSQKSVKLFLGITTSFDEKGRKLRDTVRKTWLNYDNPCKGFVEHKFFLGISPEGKNVTQEELALGDIVFLPFIDTYQNLSRKTMQVCKWATDHYDFDYMAKMDDDTFMRLDRIVPYLIKNGSLSKYYAGKTHPVWRPTRDPTISKWAVSEKEFPQDKGPAWAQGFLYFLSYDSPSSSLLS